MSMHVNLSSEMEAYVKGKVASGFYGNATEVIRDAIRRMQEDEKRKERLHAAIAKGQADFDAGRIVRYTPELMEEIFQEALAKRDSNEPFDPDVIPE